MNTQTGLTELGERIFFDRYAVKDMERKTFKHNDLVIVNVDGQREIGKIESISGTSILVNINDAETIQRDITMIDKPLETHPKQMWSRIASAIAMAEEEDKQQDWAEKFYWLLEDFKFVPGGRIMAGAGAPGTLTYLNCFTVPVLEDSRSGILKALSDMTEIMSRGGGVGINLSMLRPKYNYVKGVNGRSSGSVSWGSLYSFATGLIEQGGCFAGETRIATNKGWITAKKLYNRLKEGEEILAHTHHGFKKFTDFFSTGFKEVFVVTTEEGYEVKVTKDHKFVVELEATSNIQKPLEELNIGDSVFIALENKWLKGTLSELEENTDITDQLWDRPFQHNKELGFLGYTESKITSIQSIGQTKTFDFEVEDIHLMIAEGFYVSNSRRGALMLMLADWHPDVIDFINCKREAGKVTNANISVCISDKFMEAVKNDEDWKLVFPSTDDPDYDTLWDGDLQKWIGLGKPVIEYRTLKARQLWDMIIESAWTSAEPGLWFQERSEKLSNSYYYDRMYSVNPCGEQPLPGYGNCNLGAINLAKFYDEETSNVDWLNLQLAISYGVRFLDNVIDATPQFMPEIQSQMFKERRVGLGIMGLAELLILMGIQYGDDESVRFVEKLFKFMCEISYRTSVGLAVEKDVFPAFNRDKYLQSGFVKTLSDEIQGMIYEYGIRNVTLLTIAPTGSSSSLVNTSSGIEPFFSWEYWRKSRLGLYTQTAEIAQTWLDNHPDRTISDLPDYFVTAMDLTPEGHVKVMAAAQKWVDSAISKTINCPNTYTIEQTKELYQLMYDLGCKGGTIYRDGSRDEQVLMLKKEEKQEVVISPQQRPHELQGTTASKHTGFGTIFVTMNDLPDGTPRETFINIGRAGSDLQADAEAIGRLISYILAIVPEEKRFIHLLGIVDQLKGIGGSTPFGLGINRVSSMPDAVAKILEQHYVAKSETYDIEEIKTSKSRIDICPECHNNSLVHESGCKNCFNCGYSAC